MVTLNGTAPANGSRFTFATDNGVVSIDVGATVADVATLPDQSQILAVVTDPPGLVAVSPAGDTVITVALPGAVRPSHIAFSPDGDFAFISDRAAQLLHLVDLSSGNPASYVVSTAVTPVAGRQFAVTPDGRRGFLLANGSNDVFVFDVNNSVAPPILTPLDVVGRTPGIDPVPFPGGVRAIGAGLNVQTQRTGAAAYPIIVTTHAGHARFLNGNTGCQDFVDDRGARLDLFRFNDLGSLSAPLFDLETFETSKCGGVARSEEWTVRYSGGAGGYEVTGSSSGIQAGLAIEGEFYETDRGELRFQIIGSTEAPTDDGDVFRLTISDGISPLRVGELPGDIVFVMIEENGEPVEYALVANPGNDLITQIDVERRRVARNYQ